MLAFIEICFRDRFINEYARKKTAKISKSQSHGVFLVKYRRTYVIKNVRLFHQCIKKPEMMNDLCNENEQ